MGNCAAKSAKSTEYVPGVAKIEDFIQLDDAIQDDLFVSWFQVTKWLAR